MDVHDFNGTATFLSLANFLFIYLPFGVELKQKKPGPFLKNIFLDFKPSLILFS